jgi:hypothetical protein
MSWGNEGWSTPVIQMTQTFSIIARRLRLAAAGLGSAPKYCWMVTSRIVRSRPTMMSSSWSAAAGVSPAAFKGLGVPLPDDRPAHLQW